MKALAYLVVVFALCVVSALIGIWAAGPMPVIARDVPEPERNYTQETLRILNPPPPAPVVRYEPAPRRGPCLPMSIATATIYNGMPGCD